MNRFTAAHPVVQDAAASGSHPVTPEPRQRRSLWMLLGVLLASTLIGGILSMLLLPAPRLGAQRIGDQALAREAAAALGSGSGIYNASVARIVKGSEPTFAGLGDAGGGQAPSPDAAHELGSITKTFTGMLLADAVERGEMKLDDPVSAYLPELAGSPAGSATLKQLATHTSGLPSVTSGEVSDQLVGGWTRTNPYGRLSVADLLSAAKDVPVSGVGTSTYSNLGIALLGHAEARAAHVDGWPTLVQQRIFEPLGMRHTTIVPPAAEDAALVQPRQATGRPNAPWSGPAYAPAGSSTRTTARDLSLFAIAILDGRAPGMKALDPVMRTDGDDQIGLAWNIMKTPQGVTTLKNGGTGGTRTILAVDRSAGRAALVLASTDRFVDAAGERLVHPTSSATVPAPRFDLRDWIPMLIGVVGGVHAWWAAARSRNRLGLLGAAVEALLAAAIIWVLTPWHLLPAFAPGALLAAVVMAAVVALVRLPNAHPWPEKGRVLGVIELVTGIALLGLMATGL